VKCNQPGVALYLIHSGTVSVMDSSGQEVTDKSDFLRRLINEYFYTLIHRDFLITRDN
jgi:hypothetical protein